MCQAKRQSTSRSVSTQPTTKQIRAYVRKLGQFLDGLEILPATHCYRSSVLLALLSKALTVSRAICVLVDRDFPAEAFGLSRTLIDLYFTVRFISNKETEPRAKAYVEHYARIRKEWQEIIRKHYPQKPLSESYLDAEVLEAAAAFKSKVNWTGQSGQSKAMALEEDTVETNEKGEPFKSEFDYDAIYFWTSQFVHGSVAGIAGHASPPGEPFRVHAMSIADKGCARNSLFNISVYLCKTFVCALRAMNLEQPKALQDLFNQIAKLAPEPGDVVI